MSDKKTGVFLFGAVGYACIEVICRGRTHWSMAIAGGVCLLLMRAISGRLAGRSLFLQGLAAAGAVTLLELAVGLVVNRWLGWQVWDYSTRPLHLLGQVCPLYSFFWFLLSLPLLAYFRAGQGQKQRGRG